VDRRDFPNVGVGIWWALQTVTTVGYGDVTPKNAAGRLIAAAVMLESIAFITVVTAVITSNFVTRARQERGMAESPDRDLLVAVAARLDDITTRLERIESALDGQRKAGPALSSGGGP
jgi:voltage-gated potassium channel Kch